MSLQFSPYLFALVLVSIPIVLYLLYRLRRRNVEWGASYILQLTLQKKVKESRWRQYVVLATRTLALTLLVLAFCGPLLKRAHPFGHEFPRGGSGSLTRIILLDNSESMLAEHGNSNRFAEAKRLAADLLAGAAGGDSFAVIPLCATCSAIEFLPPARQREVAARLEAIPIAHEPIDLVRGLDHAYRRFLSTVTAHRQLIVLSDLAASDLQELASLRPFAKSLREAGVECYFHGISEPDDSNVALCSASLGTELPLAGQAYNLYIEVANYSAKSRAGDRVFLMEDSKIVQETDLDLAPNERKQLRMSVALPAGEHTFELRLREDTFAPDNSLLLSAAGRPALSVLVLKATEDEQKGFEAESEFVRRALDSIAANKACNLTVAYRTLTTVGPEDVGRSQVIICAGVNLHGSDIEPHVRRFLRSGGGLILGLSPDGDRGLQRAALRELCQVELGEPYVDKLDYERYLFIQKDAIPHLLLREFTTNLNADISKARIYNHFRVAFGDRGDGSSMSATRRDGPVCLLRLSNGDPILAASRFGRGTVLLWTSTLSGRWNSLVVRESFLPLLHRMLDLAASGQEPPRNVQQGEPIISRVPPEGKLFIAAPDNALHELGRVHASGETYIRFERTRVPGLYTLTDEAGRTLKSFTVAPRRSESDIRPLSPDDARLLEKTFDTRLTHTESELRSAMLGSGYTLDLISAAIVGLLALLVVEAVLLRVWF